ncbi:3-oxoadipate CoA-transferase subunit B [Primorskyibacter flagellatus]|uniref:3-oxoadipate CoA-transferase subunit B n=1 Tax=Primorskyibacter flagellatus TaxID=1387277 RepID=A0A917AG34_9RHOB|nr:3-oxoacid CoA-transferase subunit B [Primorskyibacter flagellatus]GGE50160.1 3-oxoadipate CoA-transferase subunit B [Primorskyibacter flagellatus]
MTGTPTSIGLDTAGMAKRLADDIHDAWYVNLGVGLPTEVANYVTEEREVVFHSENGILGMGPTPGDNEIDPWLVNAGKKPVTLRPGASLFHHADSFAMIRGGHIDLCVLGGYEVSQAGDLANWTTPSGDLMPAVGGAMDLAVGAKRTWILMRHTTKDGQPKLVETCTYPLTAPAAVDRVYTELGVFEIRDGGLHVVSLSEGLDLETVQARTGATLHA